MADGSVSSYSLARSEEPAPVVAPTSWRAGFVRRFAFAERRSTRRALNFFLYALPFFVAGIGYEIFRLVVHLRGEIHVRDLFELEARAFPVTTSSGTVALSDVIARAQHPLLDVICGVSYLVFLLEVFGLAAYFFFKRRPKMLSIAFGFLFLNLVGWMIWLAYPAAPPWYVDAHGLGPARLDVASSPAGLLRLDTLLGVPVAASFYAKSANVFGAMPSLHVGYAVMVAFIAYPLRSPLRGLTLAFAACMAFSAVYLRHHYILDVVAGVLVALPVAWFSDRLAHRVDQQLGFAP